MINDLPNDLKRMLDDLQKHGKKDYVSDLWKELEKIHIELLTDSGYDNFKHTIAGYYFTHINEKAGSVQISSQWNFLIKNLSKEKVLRAKEIAKKFPPFKFTRTDFNLITLLMWQFAIGQGLEKELARLDEPMEGA